MVLKIDLGGMLSPSNMFGSVTRILGLRDAWIESILMTAVTLKDRAEQARFVSSPFSSDPGPLPQNACALSNRASTSLCRWTDAEQRDLSGLRTSSSHQSDAQRDSTSAQPFPLQLETSTPPELRSTGTLDPVYWMSPGAAGFRVRGPNYLVDKKKIPAEEPVFKLASVDLVKLDQPTPNIAQHLYSVQNSTSAFSFVVQIMVPGPPHLALVLTWGSKDDSHNRESASMSLDDAECITDPEPELPPFDFALAKCLPLPSPHAFPHGCVLGSLLAMIKRVTALLS